ncbi:unnamed protein product [Protopolystoma xenopodis]|uniref:Uncharacterized protein n=1 Tax=Protopolystoma xenopodis TaxID=117903 RepID=A0A448XEB6_9PLAT|nr:unnamed protein product [Protopolystoma xenopodis]
MQLAKSEFRLDGVYVFVCLSRTGEPRQNFKVLASGQRRQHLQTVGNFLLATFENLSNLLLSAELQARPHQHLLDMP